MADAVVFGNLLMSLIRHADRVTSASLAQLVNVIAPIMTEPGGLSWRQTTFFPFAVTSQLARGVALELKLETEKYQSAVYGEVAVIDAVATHDAETGKSAVFLVNRSQTEAVTVTIDVSGLDQAGIISAQTLSNPDVYAKNTLEQPNLIRLTANDSIEGNDGTVTIELPLVSWTAISLG